MKDMITAKQLPVRPETLAQIEKLATELGHSADEIAASWLDEMAVLHAPRYMDTWAKMKNGLKCKLLERTRDGKGYWLQLENGQAIRVPDSDIEQILPHSCRTASEQKPPQD